MTTAHTKANSIFSALFMDIFLSVLLVSDVALIITFLFDLHDVIRFPSLVEELDVGSVKADDRHEIPTIDGLNPVGIGHALRSRRPKEEVAGNRNGNEICFFWIAEFLLFSQRYDNFVQFAGKRVMIGNTVFVTDRCSRIDPHIKCFREREG
jgi:hypothetical protein